MLSVSSATFAVGLTLLGSAHSIALLVAAWVVLGVGMGLGLYDEAFGARGRIYGSSARRAITGIKLLAGFASTVGWPSQLRTQGQGGAAIIVIFTTSITLSA